VKREVRPSGARIQINIGGGSISGEEDDEGGSDRCSTGRGFNPLGDLQKLWAMTHDQRGSASEIAAAVVHDTGNLECTLVENKDHSN